MTTLAEYQQPLADTTAPTSNADGHFYGYTKSDGWFPLYKDDGDFKLAQAREMIDSGAIAMPSATGYLSVLPSYQLEKYGKENAAKAGRITPMEGALADEKAWLKHVLTVAASSSHGARDKGSRIHKAFENANEGKEYDAEYAVYVDPLQKMIADHGLTGFRSEVCVGSLKYGVGGKADIIHDASMTIADIKTRGHKLNKVKVSKVPCYEKDRAQLAIYGYCEFGNAFFLSGRGIIGATSTTQPGLVTPYTFTGKELVPDFEAFLAATTIWRWLNDLDPRRPLFEEGVV
jgi:hypothetical protein